MFGRVLNTPLHKGVIHLHMQNFPENYYFLPPDMHTYACASRGRNVSFSENFACVLNEWPPNYTYQA